MLVKCPPNDYSPQWFAMYRSFASGIFPQLCITCLYDPTVCARVLVFSESHELLHRYCAIFGNFISRWEEGIGYGIVGGSVDKEVILRRGLGCS